MREEAWRSARKEKWGKGEEEWGVGEEECGMRERGSGRVYQRRGVCERRVKDRGSFPHMCLCLCVERVCRVPCGYCACVRAVTAVRVFLSQIRCQSDSDNVAKFPSLQ